MLFRPKSFVEAQVSDALLRGQIDRDVGLAVGMASSSCWRHVIKL